MRIPHFKNKETLILLAVGLIFFLLLAVTSLFFQNRTTPTSKKNHREKVREMTLVEGTFASDHPDSDKTMKKKAAMIGSTAYFLSPSAQEILDKVQQGESVDKPKVQTGPEVKIMWPGYFFSLKKDRLNQDVMELDVDKESFGVVLLCLVNLKNYPEVRDLKPGQKIWVAGAITGIDPAGTGAINIKTEYIRFDEGPLAAQRPQNKK